MKPPSTIEGHALVNPLLATISVLEVELEALKNQRNPNSRNIHCLSSPEGYRKKSTLPRKRHKKGGQPGHQGNTPKAGDTPDEITEPKPEVCQACRRGLTVEPSDCILVSRRQMLDIPLMTLQSTEYRGYGYTCAHCGTYNQLLKAGFEETPLPKPQLHSRGGRLNTKDENLPYRLDEKQEAMLPSAGHRCVPFTDNLAERDIRPAKTKLVAGCFRTCKGAQGSVKLWAMPIVYKMLKMKLLIKNSPLETKHYRTPVYARINGFISTVRKQGISPFNEFRVIFSVGMFPHIGRQPLK